jgi:hypothetical protein
MDIENMAHRAGMMKYITPPGAREWHGTIEDIASLVSSAILSERVACCKAIDAIDDGEAPEYRACQEAIMERSNV